MKYWKYSIIFLICLLLFLPVKAAEKTGQPKTSGILPILMFHHIQPLTKKLDHIDYRLSYEPDHLEKLAVFLTDHKITTLKMSDLADFHFDKKATLLTFDDGYDDFYTYAFPILKKYSLKATLFVITGKMDTPHYLTTAQVKEVFDSGLVEIGSHTVTHPTLTTLHDDKLLAELSDSKKTLETLLGTPVTAFCYPSGRTNNHVRQMVEKTGYQFARATKTNLRVDLKKPFDLPMVRVTPDTNILSFKQWWQVR